MATSTAEKKTYTLYDCTYEAWQRVHLKTFHMLIKHGMYDDGTREKIIHHAILHGRHEAITLLRDTTSITSITRFFELAIKYKRPEAVQFFLDHQLILDHEINTVDKNECSLLVKAITDLQSDQSLCYEYEAITILRILIERADLTQANGKGETPLMSAARLIRHESINMILAHAGNTIGISPILHAVDKKGQTALFHALQAEGYRHENHHLIKSIEILLSYNANVNHVDNAGNTPLMLAPRATFYRIPEVTRLLLAHGAKPLSR